MRLHPDGRDLVGPQIVHRKVAEGTTPLVDPVEAGDAVEDVVLPAAGRPDHASDDRTPP